MSLGHRGRTDGNGPSVKTDVGAGLAKLDIFS
jgi:hypothetical protein